MCINTNTCQLWASMKQPFQEIISSVEVKCEASNTQEAAIIQPQDSFVFIHLFNQHLLSPCNIPGAYLDARIIVLNKIDEPSFLVHLSKLKIQQSVLQFHFYRASDFGDQQNRIAPHWILIRCYCSPKAASKHVDGVQVQAVSCKLCPSKLGKMVSFLFLAGERQFVFSSVIPTVILVTH